MSEDERAELEAMRAREAEWEAHLEAQEARMAEAQAQQWAQERERDAMREQWEHMKQQARTSAALLSVPLA